MARLYTKEKAKYGSGSGTIICWPVELDSTDPSNEANVNVLPAGYLKCVCTTVHPAASAGAIFHVDNIKGVFQGVMMPTGPMGTRVVIFINVGLLRC